MKWVTFTGAVPGVDVTVGHYQPRGLVSWTGAVDPYTFYVPQTTIAAKREPFEIASLLRVQVPLRDSLWILAGTSVAKNMCNADCSIILASPLLTQSFHFFLVWYWLYAGRS